MGKESLLGSPSPELLAERERYIARGVSSAAPMLAESAHGAQLVDADGREFIDFAAGISVLNAGHNHPRVVEAIKQQADRLVHSGAPVVLPRVYLDLAKRLCDLTPGEFPKKALLVNSGAEAVENAVKIARQATGRPVVFSFQNSFHGRTLLTLTLTGKALPYRQNFGPYAPAVHHLPFPDPFHRPSGTSVEELTDFCLRAVEEAFKTEAPADQVAAIIVEPVQGEGGFIVPPANFLPRLADLCRRRDIPLIADEIQTGFGRTGAMFAVEHWGVTPDLMTLAKSIAGGLPLAAVVGRSELMDATAPGGLGGTFGGNPIACAAALALIDVLEEENLPARARDVGDRTLARLRGWQQRYPAIGDVRGLGAMVAMEFVADGGAPAPEIATGVARVAREGGLLILKAGLYDNVLRFLMPLNTPWDVLERGLDILEASLAEVLA